MLSEVATRSVVELFRAASWVRGARAIHGKGWAYAAELEVLPSSFVGATLLTEEVRTWPAVVRFSRALGLPRFLPDVYGAAVRVEVGGEKQDLLLSTGTSRDFWRRWPLPARRPLACTYSSIMSYDIGGTEVLLGLTGEPGQRLRPHDGLTGCRFLLTTAQTRGAWTPLARLVIGAPLVDPTGRDLDFAVSNAAGGLRNAGPLYDLRARAYPASRTVERVGRLPG